MLEIFLPNQNEIVFSKKMNKFKKKKGNKNVWKEKKTNKKISIGNFRKHFFLHLFNFRKAENAKGKRKESIAAAFPSEDS